MEQKIYEKLRELKELNPQNKEFKKWLSDSNLWGWLYSQFKINGQAITKPAVVDLVNGTIREDVPLSCYSYVQGYKEMHQDMQEDLVMGATPNLKQFSRWFDMLFPGTEWRKHNPVLFEYGFIPCHFNTVPEELEAAFRNYATSKLPGMITASILFLEIVRIYPFDEESVDMAMAELLYCIESMGLPVPELSAGEEELGKLITSYMNDGDYMPFADMLQRSIYNRLDVVVMVAKQAKENE